jgi:hypothetical protein
MREYAAKFQGRLGIIFSSPGAHRSPLTQSRPPRLRNQVCLDKSESRLSWQFVSLKADLVGSLSASLRHGSGPLCIVMLTVLPIAAIDPPVGD